MRLPAASPPTEERTPTDLFDTCDSSHEVQARHLTLQYTVLPHQPPPETQVTLHSSTTAEEHAHMQAAAMPSATIIRQDCIEWSRPGATWLGLG